MLKHAPHSRTTTTITTHNGRVITPEKEISLTAQLIPQHVENFPFADSRRFAQRITSGQFKGKLRICLCFSSICHLTPLDFFALDFETTGLTRKELPRILEISLEHIPEDKLPELQAPPPPEGAQPSNIDPQSQCNMESPTTTDNQYYSLIDPGIPSSVSCSPNLLPSLCGFDNKKRFTHTHITRSIAVMCVASKPWPMLSVKS